MATDLGWQLVITSCSQWMPSRDLHFRCVLSPSLCTRPQAGRLHLTALRPLRSPLLLPLAPGSLAYPLSADPSPICNPSAACPSRLQVAGAWLRSDLGLLPIIPHLAHPRADTGKHFQLLGGAKLLGQPLFLLLLRPRHWSTAGDNPKMSCPLTQVHAHAPIYCETLHLRLPSPPPPPSPRPPVTTVQTSTPRNLSASAADHHFQSQSAPSVPSVYWLRHCPSARRPQHPGCLSFRCSAPLQATAADALLCNLAPFSISDFVIGPPAKIDQLGQDKSTCFPTEETDCIDAT